MKTMRLPSRFIPPRPTPRLGLAGTLALIAMLGGFGCFIYSLPNPLRCITAVLVCALYGYDVVVNRREKHRFKVMASSRIGESICEFARSFNARQTDTWIIRVACQELQLLLQSYVPAFPVRASDSLLNDLKIDPDDVEDLLQDIAERSRRSLDQAENNPYFRKVQTVSDLVFFINAQPAKG